MKIARLLDKNIETYGFINEDKVATKDEIICQTGIPIPHNVKDFLFDGWYDEIKSKIESLPYKKNVSKFKLLSPIPNPNKIICLAYNYSDHAKKQGLQAPKDPVIVIKPRTTLTGTESRIVCPDFVSKLDYEIELAVIVKRDCKNISIEDASRVVFGYMVFNDVSARDIQFKDKQFTRAKSFDSFAPCGPWITTADEIQDAQNLKMTTKINGETRQDSSTSNMSIKIPEIISKISRVMTLEEGDIIATGTPAGVALDSPNAIFLKDADRIEMEIEGLGVLKNTIRFVRSDQEFSHQTK